MEMRREASPPPGTRQYVFGRSKEEFNFMRGDPLFDADVLTRIGPVFSPAFDLIETPEKYTLLADLPGLGLRDLDIELTADILTVSGEREPECLANRATCHALERTFGSFFRTFHLPELGSGACFARMRNGVLTVDVPKNGLGPAPPESPWH
jgi:HSP20 family molecular chaperone IbpA